MQLEPATQAYLRGVAFAARSALKGATRPELDRPVHQPFDSFDAICQCLQVPHEYRLGMVHAMAKAHRISSPFTTAEGFYAYVATAALKACAAAPVPKGAA
jgi:hypothetical protein